MKTPIQVVGEMIFDHFNTTGRKPKNGLMGPAAPFMTTYRGISFKIEPLFPPTYVAVEDDKIISVTNLETLKGITLEKEQIIYSILAKWPDTKAKALRDAVLKSAVVFVQQFEEDSANE